MLTYITNIVLFAHDSFRTSFSEIERNRCHAQVLLLLELVLQGRQELRVHLAGKLLDILDGLLKVLLLVTGPLFHLRVPGINLLNGFGTENE